MTPNQNKVLRLVTPPSDTGRLLAQGLVDLYKAVKGASFYPEGHPYRTAPLQRSFDAFARLVEKREVLLTVSRQGFAPGLEVADGNPMLLQLAQEFLMRRISSITFTRELLASDLETFVELFSNDPQRTAALGGFARQLKEAGAQTVKVQEKDLSAIWARRGGGAGAGATDGAGGEDELPPLQEMLSAPEPTERHSIAELLVLMAHESVDARYQQLGRDLVEKFTLDKETTIEFRPLPILQELLRQHLDPQKSLPQREYALFTLERLAEGTADVLLDALEKRECPDKEAILRVLAALGGKGAYRIIQRLCLAEEVYQRKALAVALVRLGPPATGPVVEMLKDQRWYVVRNMVTILGELRCPETAVALKRPLRHEDLRVRKEAVRALMKIGGELAETTLIGLIEEQDHTVARHAILSLGLMHSRLAVVPLLKLLERRDLMLKTLGVKKEIVLALGRIGDRRATPALMKILGAWRVPVMARQHELKLAAASALGTLGDEAALPLLGGLARGNGPLAEACRESVDAIERLSGGIHD